MRYKYYAVVYDNDDYVTHHYILDEGSALVWTLWVEDGEDDPYYAEEIASAREHYSC